MRAARLPDSIQKEVQKLSKCRHRNIVYFIGWALPQQLLGPGQPPGMALILEYCTGGMLRPDSDFAPEEAAADRKSRKDMRVTSCPASAPPCFAGPEPPPA